ncbi:hypothetical protein K431DRAFT_231229 [Polychaeton citri CBS 116435]|uniref:Peptide N-acetyl-beta-D-glucosaminyl asparaginase amidase A N-terminal domain-containing protein n=1 Tax=Polychaeton citri CBS 116435 TaxID=1314669 RepID=A0A9P4Q4F0_9PEZI|nr:hypothetical protein K431DRAFT_231229 [Polychaeton citri CBS 116435]
MQSPVDSHKHDIRNIIKREVLESGADVEKSTLNCPPLVKGNTRQTFRRGLYAASALIALLVLFHPARICIGYAPGDGDDVGVSLSTRSAVSHLRAVTSSLLEVFQVSPPVLTVDQSGGLEITDGSSNASVKIVNGHSLTCQDTLVEHVFAFSYGQPFVSSYAPPGCTFNRVTWNLTVTSAGRQFDRLGSVSLGDIEVWRTSTAEPTKDGIIWTYLKDMTAYHSLLKQEQKIIFDLGNLIDDVYTGTFNVTLTASHFTADASIDPADLILPVSGHCAVDDQPSLFQVPPQTAQDSLKLPQNIKKAVFTISATGQIGEEFWWSNVLSSDVDTFPQYGELYGYSPFREIQLLIDGSLAGVAWPFPVIFTGGVVPGLWRPIVGIDAFDLQEDEIDITPWLPLLCDGSEHTFQLIVSGLNNTGSGGGAATLSEVTGGYWLLSGKIFVWLDGEGHVTTGHGPHATLPDPHFQTNSLLGKSVNGSNETLDYYVGAQRSLSIESTVKTSEGQQLAFWRQDLSYSNTGNFTDGGYVTVNTQQTSGSAESSSGYARKFAYPLYAFQSYTEDADNFTISAVVNRGKHIQTVGQPVFPTGLESFGAVQQVRHDRGRWQGASLDTTQNGSATYTANTTSSTAYSFGQTEQDMTFKGISVRRGNSDGATSQGFPPVTGSQELFSRHVLAVNGSIEFDQETLANSPVNPGHSYGPHPNGAGFTLSGVNGHGRRAHGSRQGGEIGGVTGAFKGEL